MVNWVAVFNRLFELINEQGDSYYGGTRFLNVIREVNYSVPSYNEYISQRQSENKSTTRRDYYYDLILEQKEADRFKVVERILETVEESEPIKVANIRKEMGGGVDIEAATVIPDEIWNCNRLTYYLEKMDTSINEQNYDYALTLAYTCLEGFYKSFIKLNIPEREEMDSILPMSKEVKGYIQNQLSENNIAYPEQVLNLISTITNAICNARNNFSDSHSGNSAEKWLAVYLRDNVNSIVKMILNFV